MKKDIQESPVNPGLSFHIKFQQLILIPLMMLAVLLLPVIGFGMLHPDSYGELREIWSGKKTLAMMCAGVFLFLCIFSLVSSLIFKLNDKKRKHMLLILAAAGLMVQLILVLRYPIQIWWDNTSVLSSAISIVTGNRSFFDKDYFNQLGHQNCFLLLTVILYKAALLLHIPKAYITLYFSIIDMIALDASAFLTYLTVKRVKGVKSAEQILLLTILCPGMYLWAGYYYTTNMSVLFLAIYIYLVCLSWEKKRGAVFYFLTGILAGFGCSLRATMLIAVIATFAYACFRLPKAPLKALLVTGAGAVICTLFLNLSYQKMIPDYDKEARFPVTHWLMMAARGNGEYNDADLAFTDSFPTRAEKEEATKNEYFRRLRELGPAGCIKLAAKKTVHNYSYGNHSYYPLFHRYDRLSDILWTPDHQIMFYIEQIWHMALLVMCFVSVILAGAGRFTAGRSMDTGRYNTGENESDKKSADPGYEVGFDGLVQITMVGGFLFYMLWETYPYYSVGFLMIFIYLAADGLGFVSGLTHRMYELPLTEQPVSSADDKRRSYINYMIPVAVVLSLFLVSAVLITTHWPENVKPVVTQKKYNKMFYMGKAERIEQTFRAERDFDTITFWITKKDLGDKSGGEYDIILSGERSGEVLREAYSTAEMERIDEYTRSFPVVKVSSPEEFTLVIERKGKSSNPLGVGAFGMPVEAYMYGELKKDGKAVDDEMFFTVTLGGSDGVIRLYD